jgi:PTS system mannose-specific IIA component
MIGILVTSHGDFCHALVKTGEMIVGKRENVICVSLEGDGIEAYSQKLTKTLNEMCTRFTSILLLCDLKGGTPCNESLRYVLTNESSSIKIVPGVNLPMYLEVVSSTGFVGDINELAIIGRDAGIQSIEIIDI